MRVTGSLMILSLFLISCKEDKGPIEVPGIIYHIEEMQSPLGMVETYKRDGYILSGWYSNSKENLIGVAIFMRIDKEGNLKRYKVLPNLYATSKIYQDLQNPNDYVFVITGGGIAKMDSNFNIKWVFNRQLLTMEYIADVLDTLGGNFILVGGSEGEKKLIVWEINSNGEVIDSFVYQFESFTFMNPILEVSNNTILVAVENYRKIDTSNYIFEIILIKLNENLDTLWTKRITLNEMFNGAGLRSPKGLMRTNDGGYILFANYWTRDNKGNPYKLTGVVIKLDGNGNVIKVRRFNEPEFGLNTDFETLQDGHAFVKLSDGNNMAIIFDVPKRIWKFDDNLNTIFIKDYPLETGNGILYRDSDNNIAYLTETLILDYLSDFLFTKIDNDGNILIWSKVYPDE